MAEDNINCKIVDGGTLLQFDRVRFVDNDIDFGVLTERDKKDIMW
jgi:pyruvate kinase